MLCIIKFCVCFLYNIGLCYARRLTLLFPRLVFRPYREPDDNPALSNKPGAFPTDSQDAKSHSILM